MILDVLMPLIGVMVALAAGIYVTWVLDQALAARLGSVPHASPVMQPLYQAASLWLAPVSQTEAPDTRAWRLTPVLYLVLAAMGLALVPWSAAFIPVDLTTGVVFWGALEPLATILIFLHGWSPNAHLAMLGGYRYVSLGLSYLLISMFVLIGVALPAESLRFSAVVEAQEPLWNVIRQPLGLPLFLIVGLGISFWGPLNFADSRDLSGGTSADVAGRSRLLWQMSRAAMLFAFSAIAATAFLGGWLGPVLPGPVWLLLKTLLVLGLVLALGRLLPRPSPEQFLTWAWVVLLPLAFVDLAWAGLEALP